MIHLIVLMHFASITIGVLTLILAGLQFGQQKDDVAKWFFYEDLMLTLLMVLDAIKLYVAKNILVLSPDLSAFYEVFIFLLSTFTLVSLAKLIWATTRRSMPTIVSGLFILIAALPIITLILDNIFHFHQLQYIIPVCFGAMVLCCTFFGVINIKFAHTPYRPITITSAITMAVFFMITLFANLPGRPGWIDRIPYFQMIYFFMSLLGLIYFIKAPDSKFAQLFNAPKLQTDINCLNRLSEEFNLTDRELEIISEVIEGNNNKQISDKLFISPHTVKNHVYHIYKKIGIKNRYELIALISKNK